MTKFFNRNDDIGFSSVFSFVYVSLLMFTILISIAAPIDGAIPYFRVVAGIFSVLTIISVVGIASFLTETGFLPPVKEYDPETQQWTDLTEPPHFCLLTLSGVVMLAIYFVPILLRPKDFFFNIG